MGSERDLPVEEDYKDFGQEGMIQPELYQSNGRSPRILPLLPPSPAGQSSLVVDDDPLGKDMALEGPGGRAVVHFPQHG
ncbi:hypothetical protein Srot_1161 [Segniliparus rotundus DSM 44985]|uniref:Uncharacterized protein n=1 Tax=Segniliparus rotundus (strain ATCC BAA-972 / CDC 1076 / CIP 108378 / DSM 44985 / JCM 13578) TaxID=640132 RepID=D6ZFA9_SEGRD|nr:hypothetical protein [Segniliparus rotundus]ADG97633.1 hypothetical protein Srot_1161 [Segniliparus rotundus DSM 44985]